MSDKKEVNRILNVIPSKDTQNDWSINTAVEAGMLAAPAALPASVDLRQGWWKIGNQGGTGACVGWGTAEGVLRLHFANAGRIPKTDGGMLSPRFIWMAAKETDEFITRPTTFIESDGTSLKSALDIARKFGAVKNSVLPFSSGTLYQGDVNTFYAIASQLKISAYFNFQKNLNQWRTWLASNGPILAALSVDATWDHAAATHGNLDVFQPNTVRGGHCISIVGYRADGRFIVRNSWGTTWGDQGFGFATEAYIQAAFFNEAYGVNL
jgi:Papain family cysteine protease